jgi:hypothetical protein
MSRWPVEQRVDKSPGLLTEALLPELFQDAVEVLDAREFDSY